MTHRITRATVLVMPVVLLASTLALAAAVAVGDLVTDDPCAIASPSPSPTASASPSPTTSPSPTEPSPTESSPTESSPAPESSSESLEPRAGEFDSPTVPESTEPEPNADPCSESLSTAAVGTGSTVLKVVPDAYDLVFGAPVPTYTFTLLDTSVSPAMTVDPITLSPLAVPSIDLSAYVPPVCTTDHQVEVPPADSDSLPTIETWSYSPTTSVGQSPLLVSCTGGTLTGYTFDVTSTAELTITKALTEVTSPPSAAQLSYGQSLHESTFTGGSANVVGGGVAAGYFSFPLDSWSVTPEVGTQTHVVAFVPDDFANYEPSVTSIDVSVAQATPVIVTPPTASALVTGETLADSSLTGGVASTEGTFTFTSPSIAPTEGTTQQQVTFTPSDPTNFATSPATTVDVSVEVAPPPLDYTTTGYLGRVEIGELTNLIRPRVMVPLAFTVANGGTPLSDIDVVRSFDPVAISCEGIADYSTKTFPSLALGRSSRLVYDADDQRFVQFWKVPATRNTCYRVTTTIIDGDTIVAYFKTR
jgi:hypothetical protein